MQHDPEQKARFRALVEPIAEVKPMFGSVAGMANTHMFAGLMGDRFGVKVSAEDELELEAAGATRDFGPPEMVMKAWLALPPSMDDEAVLDWFVRARDHAESLPPKAPRKR